MSLIAYVFRKLHILKDIVRQMPWKLRFRTPFDSQHVKESQKIVKSAWRHFYRDFSSLWVKLNWKMSILVVCKILGVFDVTWTANEKYSLRNSQNLQLPIQRQLSKKRKTFSQFFAVFVTFTLGFQYFEKKDNPHRFLYFGSYRLPKMWLGKYLKSLVSEHPSKLNMLKGLKHLWNLQTALLSQLFTTLGKTDSENVSLSHMLNVRGVF